MPDSISVRASFVLPPGQENGAWDKPFETPLPPPPSGGKGSHGWLYNKKSPPPMFSRSDSRPNTPGIRPSTSSMKPASEPVPTSHVENLLGDKDKKVFRLSLKIQSLVMDKQGAITESNVNSFLNVASVLLQLNRQCKATLDAISQPGNQTDPVLVKSLYDSIDQFDRGIHRVVEAALDRASSARNGTAVSRAPAIGMTARSGVWDLIDEIWMSAVQALHDNRLLNEDELNKIQTLATDVRSILSSDNHQSTDPSKYLEWVSENVVKNGVLQAVLNKISEHQLQLVSDMQSKNQAAHMQAPSAAQKSNPSVESALDRASSARNGTAVSRAPAIGMTARSGVWDLIDEIWMSAAQALHDNRLLNEDELNKIQTLATDVRSILSSDNHQSTDPSKYLEWVSENIVKKGAMQAVLNKISEHQLQLVSDMLSKSVSQ